MAVIPRIAVTMVRAALATALAGSAHAAVLRHSVLESDTAESLQMSRVCYGLLLRGERLTCLPRAYLIEPSGTLRMDVRVKANDRAFIIASRVLDQDVDKEFLDTLFREDSFQSVSGAASVEARYKGTSFSYTPLHALGALTIDNPSLPEIHVAGARQSVLRLTQNLLFQGSVGGVVLSPSAFYYEREFAYLDADLLTSSGQSLEKLVEKRESKKVDGDFALTYLPANFFLPLVTVHLENIGSKDACPGCEDRPIEVEPLFARRSDLSFGFDIPHPVGQSFIGARLPFLGLLGRYDRLGTGLAYTYKLASLGSYAAFSPLISTFGFLFDADFYRIGIMYSDEKQEASLRIARQKQVYVFASFSH